jgi:catalase
VHARGITASGYFEADGTVGEEPISTYSESARDPRGFAVEFYTEDGTWDLVGNDLGVFFIRDAFECPDFIHSQKPDPVTFEASLAERAFDFSSQTPEAMQMLPLVFSPAAPRPTSGTCRASAWTPARGSAPPPPRRRRA